MIMIPPYSTKTCPWINPFTSTQTAHAKATPAQAAGVYLCATAHTKRTVRRRSRNHQQPYGTDCRHRRPEIPKTPLPSRHLHRLAIRQKRHGKLDTRLEKKRLENRRQKPVKNDDLWKELDSLVQQHDVRWTWVKGHAGHPENEKADELANKGAAKFL